MEGKETGDQVVDLDAILAGNQALSEIGSREGSEGVMTEHTPTLPPELMMMKSHMSPLINEGVRASLTLS